MNVHFHRLDAWNVRRGQAISLQNLGAGNDPPRCATLPLTTTSLRRATDQVWPLTAAATARWRNSAVERGGASAFAGNAALAGRRDRSALRRSTRLTTPTTDLPRVTGSRLTRWVDISFATSARGMFSSIVRTFSVMTSVTGRA